LETDHLLRRYEREYLLVHSVSEGGRSEALSLLGRLAATMAPVPLDAMRPQHVLSYIGDRLDKGLSPRTARNQMIFVRSFATWLRSAELINAQRLAELREMPWPRGSMSEAMPNPYTVEEVREFYALMGAAWPTLPQRGKGSMQLRAFVRRREAGEEPYLYGPLRAHAQRLQLEAQVALALEAGLRRTEIYNLSITAMHYDNDALSVVTAKQAPGREILRSIPYTQHARACVRAWLDLRWALGPDHDFPWLHLSSFRHYPQLQDQLGRESFGRFAHKLNSRRFGGGDWRWHRLRHTAATEWLRSGVPIEKVRIFMGHASIEMTLRYTQILKRDISEAFAEAEADFAQRLGLAA
jgi:site-specific recombinase XerD